MHALVPKALIPSKGTGGNGDTRMHPWQSGTITWRLQGYEHEHPETSAPTPVQCLSDQPTEAHYTSQDSGRNSALHSVLHPPIPMNKEDDMDMDLDDMTGTSAEAFPFSSQSILPPMHGPSKKAMNGNNGTRAESGDTIYITHHIGLFCPGNTKYNSRRKRRIEKYVVFTILCSTTF